VLRQNQPAFNVVLRGFSGKEHLKVFVNRPIKKQSAPLHGTHCMALKQKFVSDSEQIYRFDALGETFCWNLPKKAYDFKNPDEPLM